MLVSSSHGSLIVNRFDYCALDGRGAYGAGRRILESGAFDALEIDMVSALLARRRKCRGADVVILDCGANMRGHTTGDANRVLDERTGHGCAMVGMCTAAPGLIMALDSDASVRRLKGSARPVQTERAEVDVIGEVRGVAAVK